MTARETVRAVVDGVIRLHPKALRPRAMERLWRELSFPNPAYASVQQLGRLMRPHPDKRTPILYDLVDDIPLARRQFEARQRAYRKVLGDRAETQPATTSSEPAASLDALASRFLTSPMRLAAGGR